MNGEAPNDRSPLQPELPPALLHGLKKRPAPLDLATAQRLREGILERIVEAGEASRLGQALETTMKQPIGVDQAAEVAGIADSSAVGALGSVLADRFRTVPVVAPEWEQVRAAVLPQPARRVARSLLLAGAGVAAVAVVALFLQTSSTPVMPEIQIADIQVLPTSGYSPMAVLRHGDGFGR